MLLCDRKMFCLLIFITFLVQECLGPESPSVYLAEALSNFRVAILHAGDLLRDRVAGSAAPQIKTFQVEIQDGYHAQVRLYLPPGLRDFDEMPFPLVLQVLVFNRYIFVLI